MGWICSMRVRIESRGLAAVGYGLLGAGACLVRAWLVHRNEVPENENMATGMHLSCPLN